MPISPPTYRPSFLPTKAERDRTYNRTKRDPISRAFYHSVVWLKLRIVKLTNSPYCEQCLLGCVYTPAYMVHHIQPISTHPHTALDEDNLMSMCKPCHSRLHAT